MLRSIGVALGSGALARWGDGTVVEIGRLKTSCAKG